MKIKIKKVTDYSLDIYVDDIRIHSAGKDIYYTKDILQALCREHIEIETRTVDGTLEVAKVIIEPEYQDFTEIDIRGLRLEHIISADNTRKAIDAYMRAIKTVVGTVRNETYLRQEAKQENWTTNWEHM